MDQKNGVHLHNRILHGKKKEGTPTLCNSMNGSGEYYAKLNKPGGERYIYIKYTYSQIYIYILYIYKVYYLWVK